MLYQMREFFGELECDLGMGMKFNNPGNGNENCYMGMGGIANQKPTAVTPLMLRYEFLAVMIMLLIIMTIEMLTVPTALCVLNDLSNCFLETVGTRHQLFTTSKRMLTETHTYIHVDMHTYTHSTSYEG